LETDSQSTQGGVSLAYRVETLPGGPGTRVGLAADVRAPIQVLDVSLDDPTCGSGQDFQDTGNGGGVVLRRGSPRSGTLVPNADLIDTPIIQIVGRVGGKRTTDRV